MSKLTQEKFNEAYTKHQLWINGEEGGKRLDLSHEDLTEIVFATLANLDGANLNRANLDGANLNRANLDGANLNRANLDGANLDGASLDGANLNRANLDGANLDGASLYRANLSGASLYRANLSGASLDVYQKWSVTWNINGTIYIGCKMKTITEWDAWFAGDEIYETQRNTADFERIEAAYQHAKRMYEIWKKYEKQEMK